MDDFSAKKIGEVHAFCLAGIQIIQKGKESLTNYDKVSTADDFYQKQAGKIESFAESMGIEQMVVAKSEKTQDKLLTMANMYIKDEWDNPAELLEWMGFFLGAAIVHWRLVESLARTVNNQDFIYLAEEGLLYNTDLLAEVADSVAEYASQKVSGDAV